jgi:hypothetical protein
MEAQAKGKDLGINMVTLVQKHLGTKATNEQRKAVLLGVCDVYRPER